VVYFFRLSFCLFLLEISLIRRKAGWFIWFRFFFGPSVRKDQGLGLTSNLFFIFGFFIFFFILVFIFLNVFFLNFKKNLRGINPFESGFLNLRKVNFRFTLHYFFLVLIFVFFDLEIIFFFTFI